MRRLSSTGWLLLPMVAALALRLLIPVGWMPVTTEEGVRLSWCGGFEPKTEPDPAPSPHSGHGKGHDAGHGAHGAPGDDTDKESAPEGSSGAAAVCAFAAIAMAAAEAPAGLTESPAFRDLPPLARTFGAAIGQGLAAPPPPQTGPPALS